MRRKGSRDDRGYGPTGGDGGRGDRWGHGLSGGDGSKPFAMDCEATDGMNIDPSDLGVHQRETMVCDHEGEQLESEPTSGGYRALGQEQHARDLLCKQDVPEEDV
ncbi:uncharacterized protein LOC111022357 [Momordica charantia]|uniref:Uncharacterized protein LOC111022357 n=1 Tax=Momordica charantia TaxID=3673 RepID=A0A6J1DLU1_MOMCH|nr:uncharacterized protein LOC111022357 [Momordica charantia]